MTIQEFGLKVLALTIFFPVMSIGFEVIGEQRITQILKHFHALLQETIKRKEIIFVKELNKQGKMKGEVKKWIYQIK